MEAKSITINSCAFDGTVKKSWTAQVLDKNEELITVKGTFRTEVTHPHLNVIRRDTVSYEYFWFDRWYNVFRFHEPDGAFRNYYCNICMPARIQDSILQYVDLDIDIVVDHAGRIEILDEEEFAENAERFGYSPAVHTKLSEAVAELTVLIELGKFPFDHKSRNKMQDGS